MLLLVNFPTNISPDKVRAWIKNVVTSYGFSVEQLTVQEVSVEEIQNLHQYYFQDPAPTDVITLDYSRKPETIDGILYICPNFIEENKEQYSTNKDFTEALLRVIIHGVLHLIGFDDTSPELKKEMINAENKALKNFFEK